MSVSSYRDLVAWQRAVSLVNCIYRATEGFPTRERFGLTQQVRRAAVSVASNTAEGKGRGTRRDYVQFLYRARGSLYEVETQVEIAGNLGYISADTCDQLRTESAGVARVLNGLIVAVEKQIKSGEPPIADSR